MLWERERRRRHCQSCSEQQCGAFEAAASHWVTFCLTKEIWTHSNWRRHLKRPILHTDTDSSLWGQCDRTEVMWYLLIKITGFDSVLFNVKYYLISLQWSSWLIQQHVHSMIKNEILTPEEPAFNQRNWLGHNNGILWMSRWYQNFFKFSHETQWLTTTYIIIYICILILHCRANVYMTNRVPSYFPSLVWYLILSTNIQYDPSMRMVKVNQNSEVEESQ